jgi:plastocyanin
VTMSDSFVFEPKEITVAPGETITFSNTSSNVHTVTAVEDSLPEGAKYFASGGFSSEEEARDNISEGLLRAGDQYEVTLDKPGTYQYFCIPHESSGMAGTIVVEG